MRNIKIYGFSLIEFIILIAIIVVIGVVGVPKFNEMTSNIQVAATTAVASALTASNASNYIVRKASSTAGVVVANCTDVANTIQSGLPNGYTITTTDVSADSSVTCTLTGPNSTTATFTATGIA